MPVAIIGHCQLGLRRQEGTLKLMELSLPPMHTTDMFTQMHKYVTVKLNLGYWF